MKKGAAVLGGCMAVLLAVDPNLAFAQAKAKVAAKPADPAADLKALGDTITQTCSVITDAGGAGANPTIKKVLSDLIDKAIAKGTAAIGTSGLAPDAQKAILKVVSDAGVAKQFLAGDKAAPNCSAGKTPPNPAAPAAKAGTDTTGSGGTGGAGTGGTGADKPGAAATKSQLEYQPKVDAGQFRATAYTCGFKADLDDGTKDDSVYCAPADAAADIRVIPSTNNYQVRFYDDGKPPAKPANVASDDNSKIVRRAKLFDAWVGNCFGRKNGCETASPAQVTAMASRPANGAAGTPAPATPSCKPDEATPGATKSCPRKLVEVGYSYTIAAADFDKSWHERFGVTAGLITIPFKSYGGRSIETNVSAGAFIGYRNILAACLDKDNFCPRTWSQESRLLDGIEITPVFVAAGATIGSGSFRSTTPAAAAPASGSSGATSGGSGAATGTGSTPASTGTVVGYTLGTGLVFGLRDDSNFHIGMLMGWDWADAGNAAKFKYQAKPWYSISVGYSFTK